MSLFSGDKGFMNRRIRIFGYSVGMIDGDLLDKYKVIHPYKRDVVMLNEKIGSEILGYPVTTKDDILKAEEYAIRAGYKNCGAMLEEIIRRELLHTFNICYNCNKYHPGKKLNCRKAQSPYGWCEDGELRVQV